MSWLELDQASYQRIFLVPLANSLKNEAVASLIDDGLDLVAARQCWRGRALQLAADQLTADGIYCNTQLLQDAEQRDRDELLEEMSLGGQPYKIP